MDNIKQTISTWCKELHEHLECNQCNQKLTQAVYLCDAGHFICSKCSQNEISTTKCKLCKLKYTKVRNYLAENLVKKLDTVVSILGTANEDDDDDYDDAKSVCSNGSVAWNSYECWIGKCKFEGPIDEIRRHYENKHSSLWTKNIDNKLPHKTTWKFDYAFPKPIDRILNIPDIGLFLVHIVIYDNGAMRAHLFMYDSARNAKKYQYTLTIKCNEVDMNVKAAVDTSRIPKSFLSKKGIFIPRAHVLQQEMTNHIKFDCILEIAENTLPKDSNTINEKSRARFRNRKQNTKSEDNRNILQPENRNSQCKKVRGTKENRQQNSDKGKIDDDKTAKNQVNHKKQDEKKRVEKNDNVVHNKPKKMDNCLQQSKAEPCLSTAEQRKAALIAHLRDAVWAHQNGDRSQQSGPSSQFNGGNPAAPGSHPLAANYHNVPPPLIPPQAFAHPTGYHQPLPYTPPGHPGPRTPMHYSPPPSNFPGAFVTNHHSHQPSAPVEEAVDAAGVSKYPDLTKLQEQQRQLEWQRQIDERESLQRLGQSSRSSYADRDKKDKCIIS